MVRICDRCRRELGPRTSLIAWRIVWNGTADGMVKDEPVDPKAEKIRERKGKRRASVALREQIRGGDIVGAVRVLIRTGLITAFVPDEDCDICRKMNRTAA